MFDSLSEQIKADEHKSSSNRERLMRWVLIVVVAVAVFGGIYWGVHSLSGS